LVSEGLATLDVRAGVGLLGAAILAHLGLAGEGLADAAAALERAAGLEEFLHRHLGLHGGRVERRLVLDALMDRHRRVHHRRLDHLALDHRLHLFVHVVVDVLALHGADQYLLVRSR